MYIEQAPSPFISQEKRADSEPIEGTVNQTRKEVPGVPVRTKSRARRTDGKPRFEFYKILPGSRGTGNRTAIQASSTTGPLSSDKYFLQAGSFQKAEDADNLKAKLAMLGWKHLSRRPTCRGKDLAQGARGSFYRYEDMKRFGLLCNKMACRAVSSRCTKRGSRVDALFGPYKLYRGPSVYSRRKT